MFRTDNWTNSFSIVLTLQKLKKELLFARNSDNKKHFKKLSQHNYLMLINLQ